MSKSAKEKYGIEKVTENTEISTHDISGEKPEYIATNLPISVSLK
ncbi:hypothetical protein [Halorussus sp. MSC15.2]|nr:hypothetical protein [Halorussus sp. MSC15.2]